MGGFGPAMERPQPPGGAWLDQHWTELPNNQWIAANNSGIVAQNESFEVVVTTLLSMNMDVEQVSFAFATLDLWQ
jgi:hypothetical protein